MDAIRRRAAIPLDETEIHVDRLQQAGLIVWETDQFDQRVWRRTTTGNELVVAKRLAGEEQAEEQKAQGGTPPYLVQQEQLILLAMKNGDGVTAEEILEYLAKALPTIGQPITSASMVELLLIKLREKNMATNGDESTYGTAPRWYILRPGMEYLAKRGLL